MKIFTEKDQDQIITYLQEDKMVAIMTDTVYGIMARMTDKNEQNLNLLKHNDEHKKISIIVESTEYLKQYIEHITEDKIKLIDEKLPGKYTFIVQLTKDFCQKRGFNRTDFGVRVTTNSFLQDIIKKTGPLLASSCNITGMLPCQNTEEIINQFQNTSLAVVEGQVIDNTPSTIISLLDEIKIIRP